MRTAADAALAGTDADVATMLSTGDYAGRSTEDRITVNQVIAAARADGNNTVVQRGQAALDNGTGSVMRAFLQTGQYEALAIDERVKVNQVLSDPASGPRTRNAAQVALDGPRQMLTQFRKDGQYQAILRD